MLGIAEVGEIPSLTQEFVGNWDESRAGKLHYSLYDLSPTGSKEGCPVMVNTYAPPPPLTT